MRTKDDLSLSILYFTIKNIIFSSGVCFADDHVTLTILSNLGIGDQAKQRVSNGQLPKMREVSNFHEREQKEKSLRVACSPSLESVFCPLLPLSQQNRQCNIMASFD